MPMRSMHPNLWDYFENVIPHYADQHNVWFWEKYLSPMHGYHAPSAEKLYDYAYEIVSCHPNTRIFFFNLLNSFERTTFFKRPL